MTIFFDIHKKHIYSGKKSQKGTEFLLHAFTNDRGSNADHFEILRQIEPGKKRSAHVTKEQLAELFAFGYFDKFMIRLRMKDREGVYPGSSIGIRLSKSDIVYGSDFQKLVNKITPTAKVSEHLQLVLKGVGI